MWWILLALRLHVGHAWIRASFWVVAQLGLFVRSVRVFFASYNGALSQGRPDRRAYHHRVKDQPAREADGSMERDRDRQEWSPPAAFMCLYTKSRTTHKDYRKGSVVQLDRPPPFWAFWQLTDSNKRGEMQNSRRIYRSNYHTRLNFVSF